jgi:hypothetical protein
VNEARSEGEMARWDKQELRLRKNHGWKAKPGYQIFVADRGAVRFDIPQGWVVAPAEGAVKICDREPPDDNCSIQLTIIRVPEGFPWGMFPLAQMLADATAEDEKDMGVLAKSDVVTIERPDMEIAWRETRFVDEKEQREAISRSLIARAGNLQPLITFDFWVDDAPRLYPVWDELLRSLRLGDYVADPTLGPVMH